MIKPLLRIHGCIVISSALFALACGDDSSSAGDGGQADAAALADGGGKHDASTGPVDSGSDDDAATAVDAGNAPVLPSGTGYAVVYVAGDNIGIDQRPDCEARFDAGGMTYYKAGAMELLDIGTCEQRSAAHNAHAAWGTWITGKATGKFYASDFKTFDDNDNVFHYGVGKRTAEAKLPTGKVTYQLSGGSAPTRVGDAEPGVLKAGTLTIDFGAGTVAISLTVQMADGTTTQAGTGGTYMGSSFFGNDIGVRGFVVGDAGQAAVISYILAGDADDAGSGPDITGTAGFQR